MASSQPSMPVTDNTTQAPVEKVPLSLTKFSRRVILKDVVGRGDGGVGLVGERVVIGGWVKSSREIKKEMPVQPAPVASPEPAGHKDLTCVEVFQTKIPLLRTIIKVFGGGDHRIRDKIDAVVPKQPQLYTCFLQINDGSCIPSLQVVVESTLVPPSQIMPTGTSILVEGVLQRPSGQDKHAIELKAEKVLHVGTVDERKYPLTKKRIPLEMLRDAAHFRPRTTTVASVMRIRNTLTQAAHNFFQIHGFVYVQVPVITTTDTEGSGKKFQVTTLLERAKKEEQGLAEDVEGVNLETLKASFKEKNKTIEELKRTGSNKEALMAATQDLKKISELVTQLESKGKSRTKIPTKGDKVNFAEDFFSRPTYLTVTGRLHLESYACSLGSVYSFGPTFRAERSESKKSLAEMWMVETEMAFSHLEDAMACANELLKFMCSSVLTNCSEDLMFIAKRIDKTVVDRLQSVASTAFEKVSYTEAVNILQQVTAKKFERHIEWGHPLTEEHESYLVDEIFKKPLIIYNHPKEQKPFFARVNDDGRTVASFDILVPKVGTLVRGSQNEERMNTINARIKELGLAQQEYEWCLDLRRHGTVKHSGFSLVFDQLVLYATGLNDVKDAVPFPRSFGKAYN